MEKYCFAIEMIDKAIKLDSRSSVAYYNKGKID